MNRHGCPRCGALSDAGSIFLGPPQWELHCGRCSTVSKVQARYVLVFLVGLVGFYGLCFVVLGPALAWLVRAGSGGRVLVPPQVLALPVAIVGSVFLPRAAEWFSLRFARFKVHDPAAELRAASRVVLGLLVAILCFLLWVAWRFVF